MEIPTMITNTSKFLFLRKRNKIQNILIYVCYVDNNPVCYALVMVPDADVGDVEAAPEPPEQYYDHDGRLVEPTDAQKSQIPLLRMDPKILFILQDSNFTSVNITKTEDKDRTEAVKDSMKDFNSKVEKKEQLTEDVYRNSFILYEFKSFISSDGDKYRIFMYKDDDVVTKLSTLFPPPTSE